MKWNKLITRPLNDEEKEYYKDSKIDFVWDGNEPEIGEEVLVYTDKSKRVYMDIWDILENGNGFKTMNSSVFYWMSLPEPPRIVSQQ